MIISILIVVIIALSIMAAFYRGIYKETARRWREVDASIEREVRMRFLVRINEDTEIVTQQRMQLRAEQDAFEIDKVRLVDALKLLEAEKVKAALRRDS